jgi:hypothetical protein
MTKEAHLQWSKQIWEEAYAADPEHTMQVTRSVTGAEVFCWSALSTRQVLALSRGLFATARFS